MSGLFIYRTKGERRRPAKIHYSSKIAPNKRPYCNLTGASWPLADITYIVSTDPAAVTCRRCRHFLEETGR